MNIEYIGNCSTPCIAKVAELPGRKASYKKACKAIKEQYPSIYNDLALDFYNPWEDQTKYIMHGKDKYLCLVHSQIEYLFLIRP